MAHSTMNVALLFAIVFFLQVLCTVSRPHTPAGKSLAVNFPAVMTVNGFQQGEGGGGPAACDGQYHGDDEFIVSLSFKWYASGARCGKYIRITDTSGLSISAMVVDECRGCGNEVGASPAIWHNFNLVPSLGEVSVTWSDGII